jgi:DHA2 family multidrug resistance protein
MVDLKLLKNRNFGVGCLLIFFFGIAIYSTIVVLPLFYQELLGYTAFTAGLVVAPRGLGTICGLPAIGYLSNKVDPRYLLTFGFFIFGLTTLYFGNVTLDISPTTLLIPIMITGFGLSFVFVPISIAAYGTLRNEQIGGASGLFNLMRNIGGSIGISLAQTLLTRHTAVHQNEILNSVPITSRPFQNSLAGAQHALTNTFGSANTLHPAQSLLYGELHRQAALWAFVDVFRSLCLLSFLCLAISWLFKKVHPGHPSPAAH